MIVFIFSFVNMKVLFFIYESKKDEHFEKRSSP